MADKRLHWKNLLDHLEAGVYRSTAGASPKFIYINPTLRQMLGVGPSEIKKINVSQIFVKQNNFHFLYKKLIQEGSIKNCEVRLKGKDKKILWCSFAAIAVKDKKGKIAYVDVILQDISLRKKFEQHLTESKELFQTIFNNTAAAIMVTDQDQRLVAWNPFAEKMLDMSRDDLFNKPVKELFPLEQWQHMLSPKTFIGAVQTKVIRKNGNLIDVDLSMNLLKDSSNKIIGAVGIMQDITKQKRFQEILIQSKLTAEEANNTKSLFLANMSHEVRTPIHTIKGILDLMLTEDISTAKKENLQVAKEAADQLLSLFNDMLDLSIVEAGKLKINYVEFHLPNVLETFCKGMALLASHKNLKFIASIPSQIPELVIGDPVRLRQVLVNLIDNAIKFTEKGKISLHLKIADQTQQWISLLFEVRDEGIGIPQDKQEKIFDLFTQADDTIARRFGGTGLGLAIAKRLVELMGGRIWVESKEGEGSNFSFTIAFKKTKKNGEREKIQGLRILLAEDNPVNQKITAQLLEKNGCHVTSASNGREVLEQLKGESFDIILMDDQMPELDGLATIKMIRETEKTTGAHVPIIALTASVLEEDRENFFSAGVDAFLPKPIELNQLIETMGHVCQKRK